MFAALSRRYIDMPPGNRVAAACWDVFILCVGIGLIVVAILTDRQWLRRHMLPHVFLSPDRQLLWWIIERISIAILGFALIVRIRPRLVNLVGRDKGGELAIQFSVGLTAIALSCVVSECILHTIHWGLIDRRAARQEPLRTPDTYFGWRNVPSRTGVEIFHGRRITYDFDAAGHRVAALGQVVDYDRPSILLVGESVMVGFRLNWRDSIAGQVQTMSGIQAANLAVNGYANDQMYMRLTAELPRFRRPVAVLTLFSPTLLERNLLNDRPHLNVALQWRPPRRTWLLQQLVGKTVFPWHSARNIENVVAKTQAELRATVRETRARHAEPLILVPSFMPERPFERDLRLRVLAGLPYVFVPLDSRWRLAGDGHPDARADRAMALAAIAALKRMRPDLFTER